MLNLLAAVMKLSSMRKVSYLTCLPVLFLNCLPFHLSAFPPPNMTISTNRETPTIGQSYSLSCPLSVVSGLAVKPVLKWTRLDRTLLTASNGSNLQLDFDPLLPANSSVYTCHFSIYISGVVSTTGKTFREILLTSKIQCSAYVWNMDH